MLTVTAPTASERTGDLDPIALADGTFAIVAMDQRNTLRRMLTAAGRPQGADDLSAFKADVAQALMPVASGILLDPDYGVPAVRNLTGSSASDGTAPQRQNRDNENLPRKLGSIHLSDCGILVAAEPAERGELDGEPRVGRDPAQDAAWVRAMGGAAVKYLVQMHPGRPRAAGAPDLVQEVLDVTEAVVADCRATGVPSVVENLVYALPGEELTPDLRANLVIESARLLDALQPDLLKLEYPGSPEACRRLAQTITGPWAVLSAGVPFAEFEQVLQISCDEGGASGFIAGRAIWSEAVDADTEPRRRFLKDTGRARLERCMAAIEGRARPWRG